MILANFGDFDIQIMKKVDSDSVIDCASRGHCYTFYQSDEKMYPLNLAFGQSMSDNNFLF